MKDIGRLYYIDVAKVLATFLVVFAHLYSINSSERLYIYAFHMQFFFYVSGLFFKPISFLKELRKTICKLIIPAYIYIYILYFFKILLLKESPQVLFKETISGLIFSGQISANNITWFLFTLANVRLLANVWTKSKIGLVLIIIFIISLRLITGYNFFFFLQSVVALPFYMLGYYTKGILNNEAQYNRNYFIRILISIMLLICTCLITKFNGRVDVCGLLFGNAPYGIKYFLFYLNAMIGTMLILNTALLFKTEIPAMSKTAAALISVVGLQRLFCGLSNHLIGMDQSYIYSIPVSILIIVACVLIHQPLSKIFDRIK